MLFTIKMKRKGRSDRRLALCELVHGPLARGLHGREGKGLGNVA
jgi:hypothetical protein